MPFIGISSVSMKRLHFIWSATKTL